MESKCPTSVYMTLLYLFTKCIFQNEFVINKKVMVSNRLKSEKWMNVQVGDIVKLENNEFVTVSYSRPIDVTLHYNTI